MVNMAAPAKHSATVIELSWTIQAKIVLARKIMVVLTKLSWATAIAFLPFESRPAIEKKIGDIADEPRPASKKPKKAKL